MSSFISFGKFDAGRHFQQEIERGETVDVKINSVVLRQLIFLPIQVQAGKQVEILNALVPRIHPHQHRQVRFLFRAQPDHPARGAEVGEAAAHEQQVNPQLAVEIEHPLLRLPARMGGHSSWSREGEIISASNP